MSLNTDSEQKPRAEFLLTYFKKSLVGVATFLCSCLVLANPVLNNVSSGNVSIQQTPNTTIINQSSHQAIINWQSFNIGKQQATHFQQPAGGIALNRISPTQGASSIFGVLTATGQIILINPAGIYFGPSAYVNVGGIIATTANLTDKNFLNGSYHFEAVPGYSGSIINAGQIIAAQHGLVALIGAGVENNGLIKANLGHVVLASGDAFTMNFSGDDLISFAIDTPTSHAGVDQNGNLLKDGVSNTGKIFANGGQVMVTAEAASGVLNNVINMRGMVEARSVSQQNGEIIISGSPNGGIVSVNAKLNASGKKAGQTGGTVEVTGYDVLLGSKTNIDVSGDAGGGNIFVGGNAHGAGPLPNANATVVLPGAQLIANAITHGNGGNVVVWSNQQTNYYGTIFARGGAQSGNGGQVEVSGGNLGFYGNVDTSALNGNMGSLLLDPQFVVVATGGGASLATVSSFANDPTGTDTIDPTNIDSVTSNVTLQANSDVVVNNAIAMTNSGTSLTLQAGRSILVNANLSTTNGAILLSANDNTAQSANRSTTSTGNPSGDTQTTTGNILMGAGTAINSGTAGLTLTIGSSNTAPFSPGNITALALTGGNIALTTPNAVTATGNISTGNTLNVNAGTASSISGTISGNGGLTDSGAGTLVLSAANTYLGSTLITAGTLMASTVANVLPTGTALTITSPGTFDMAGLAQQVASLAGSGTLTNSVATAKTFTVSGSSSTTFSGNITSATAADLALTKAGSSTLILSGNNTYTGATTVSAGTLSIGSTTGLGGTGATGSATSVTSGATLDINFGATGTLSDTNTITLNGAGAGSVGALTGSDTVGTDTLSNALTMGSNTTFGGSGSLKSTGVISGAFNLIKIGTGTLTLNGANTYTGTSTIDNGIVSINTLLSVSGGASSLGAPTTVANGTITLGDSVNNTLGTLSYTGTGTTSNRAFTLGGSAGAKIQSAAGSTGTLTLGGGESPMAQPRLPLM